MDDSILKIKWHTGGAEINLVAFFPCGQRELKRLLKMMDLEPETTPENVKACINYLKIASDILECNMKECSRRYFEYKQICAEHRERINSRKWANGLSITKDEITELRKDLRLASDIWHGAKRTYKEHQRAQRRGIKNLDYLQKLGEST